MRSLLEFLLAGCIALLASASETTAQDETPRVEPGSKATAGKVLEWSSPQGQPYWYRLPKKKRAGSKPNLILMLHGTGMRWGWAFWNYPIAAGKFRPHDIVIAPEGMTPGQGDTFNFLQGKRDGEQIAALIQLFRKQFDIDRVYLYGHSQGAFFCYWFAGDYPHLVDGIVAHAGNVLSVKHPKQAKERVGIGILHGKADAVVPVECAYRTERIYRKQGYKNVKLYVVEGLTERSGHWPLPRQVGEMFEWLDQVTAASPASALAAGFAELMNDKPNLETMVFSSTRVTQLMKKSKLPADSSIAQRLALLNEVLAECATGQIEALGAMPELSASKAEYGPWACHARIALRVFADDPKFQSALRKVRQRGKSHDKKAARALKAIGNPTRKAFGTGASAVEKSVLAGSYDTLVSGMRGMIESPPAGTKPEKVAALRDLLEARSAHDAAGRAKIAEMTAAVVKSFRERAEALRDEDSDR